jgi:GNAT superfamily N-acetyltransferase
LEYLEGRSQYPLQDLGCPLHIVSIGVGTSPGDPPRIEAILADWEEQTVGFALFFANYSTFLTCPGLYLEDLFVLPSHRRLGIGKALLTELARLAARRGAGRLEWSVLEWNESAIAFYESFGATVLPDWRICRVTQDKLKAIEINSP